MDISKPIEKEYPTPGMSVLLIVQSSYYLITALWPLIHIGSFMFVTGYKTDIWLVKTVGALLIPVSVTLASHIVFKTDHRAAILLGALSALSFMAIDFYYSLTGVISYVYLADGLIQLVFLFSWLQFIRRMRRRHKTAIAYFPAGKIVSP